MGAIAMVDIHMKVSQNNSALLLMSLLLSLSFALSFQTQSGSLDLVPWCVVLITEFTPPDS